MGPPSWPVWLADDHSTRWTRGTSRRAWPSDNHWTTTTDDAPAADRADDGALAGCGSGHDGRPPPPFVELPRLPPLELPTLSGRPEDWSTFRETFLQRVRSSSTPSRATRLPPIVVASRLHLSPIERYGELSKWSSATRRRSVSVFKSDQGLSQPPEGAIGTTWELLHQIDFLCRQMRRLGEDTNHPCIETTTYSKLPQWLKAKVLELKEITRAGLAVVRGGRFRSPLLLQRTPETSHRQLAEGIASCVATRLIVRRLVLTTRHLRLESLEPESLVSALAASTRSTVSAQ